MLEPTTFNYAVTLRIKVPEVVIAAKLIPEESADEELLKEESLYMPTITDRFEDFLSQNHAEAKVNEVVLEDLYDGMFCVEAEVSCDGTMEIYTPLDRYESPSCEYYPDVTDKELEKWARDCCDHYGYQLMKTQTCEL